MPKPEQPAMTPREIYLREMAVNPRFKEAPKSDEGFVIVGVRQMKLTPKEEAIIAQLEAYKGRKLTQQEINLSLQQAREMGELPRIHPDGPGYVE